MPKSTWAEMREYAQKVEARFGVRAIIIHDQANIQVGGYGRTYVMLLLRGAGMSVDQLESASRTLHDELNNLATYDPRQKYHFSVSMLDDLERWFAWADQDPIAQARGEKFAPILWQPVVYGLDKMLELRNQVAEHWGLDIFSLWRGERRRWRKRIWARLRRDEMALGVPLNRFERALLEALCEFGEELYRKGRSVIVGLDGSGRPPAVLLGRYLAERGYRGVVVDFLDPHPLVTSMYQANEAGKDEVCRQFETALAAERPELYRILKEGGKEVLLIDDQVGYGNSSPMIMRFLDYLVGGENQAKMVVLGGPGTMGLPPTWWHQKSLQGIRLVPRETISFASTPARNPGSREFYAKLEKLAQRIARKKRRRKKKLTKDRG